MVVLCPPTVLRSVFKVEVAACRLVCSSEGECCAVSIDIALVDRLENLYSVQRYRCFTLISWGLLLVCREGVRGQNISVISLGVSVSQ